MSAKTKDCEPKARTRLTQKRAAKILGVTRWHLNRVIRGHIKSVSLSRRIDELRVSHLKTNF
jgi:predicted XRE-type DNA-binding protein